MDDGAIQVPDAWPLQSFGFLTCGMPVAVARSRGHSHRDQGIGCSSLLVRERQRWRSWCLFAAYLLTLRPRLKLSDRALLLR